MITGAISGLWSTISGAIGGAITAISSGVSALGGSVSAWLWDAAGWIKDRLTDSGNWLRDRLTDARNWLGDKIGGLATTISSAVGGAVTAISSGINALGGTVGGWLQEAMSGVVNALGAGLTYFFNWLKDGLNNLVSWLVGGISWLGGQVKGIFEGLANMALAPVTQALKPGSPPQPLGQVTADLGGALMENIISHCNLVHKSPIDRGAVVAAGVGILGAVGIMQAVGGVLTMAFDATHPIKAWGLQDMFHRIVLNLMSSPITAGILSVPIAVGILTPMRQFYNMRFRPNLPSQGQADQMLFEGNITPDQWHEIYAYAGQDETYIEAWRKTMYREPAQRTLLTMMADPLITEAWVRKKLGELGLGAEDIEVLIGYKRRQIAAAELSAEEKEALRAQKLAAAEEDAKVKDIQILGAKLRDNSISDLVKGYISEGDLRSALEGLGYTPEEITFYVEDAKQDRERKVKDRLVGNYMDAYVKEIIATDDQLKGLLTTLVVDPGVVDGLVEEAYINRYKKPKEVVAVKIPELNLSALKDAFIKGLISEDAYGSELEARGYVPEDVALLVELAKKAIK